MDDLVRELNKLGYQPIFLPLTDIEPPELYNFSPQARRLVRRGPLKDYLPDAGKIQVKSGKRGNINYSYTSSKKGEAATSFLENALKCIGISSIPKINLGFAGSQDFSFAFTDVIHRSVDSSAIDRIIQKIDTGAIPQDVIDAGGIHIVYDYAYANNLVMSRGDKREFSEDISGKVGDFIDLGVKGSVTMESKTTISFKGSENERAAFAFMAGYLSRDDDDGKWEFHPEEIRRTDEQPRPYIPQRGVVLTVSAPD